MTTAQHPTYALRKLKAKAAAVGSVGTNQHTRGLGGNNITSTRGDNPTYALRKLMQWVPPVGSVGANQHTRGLGCAISKPTRSYNNPTYALRKLKAKAAAVELAEPLAGHGGDRTADAEQVGNTNLAPLQNDATYTTHRPPKPSRSPTLSRASPLSDGCGSRTRTVSPLPSRAFCRCRPVPVHVPELL